MTYRIIILCRPHNIREPFNGFYNGRAWLYDVTTRTFTIVTEMKAAGFKLWLTFGFYLFPGRWNVRVAI